MWEWEKTPFLTDDKKPLNIVVMSLNNFEKERIRIAVKLSNQVQEVEGRIQELMDAQLSERGGVGSRGRYEKRRKRLSALRTLKGELITDRDILIQMDLFGNKSAAADVIRRYS